MAKRNFTRTLNVRLTEAEYLALQELKKTSTIAELIRKSIDFYQFYHSTNTPAK